MSLERIRRILTNFGLTEAEAELYVFLAKRGPRKDRELALALRLPKSELKSMLRNLQNKGFVTAIVEKSRLFSAITFEKVLALFIKTNLEQAEATRESKEEILASWKYLIEKSDS